MEILRDIPLCDRTTIRIGGKARYYTCPRSVEELREAFRWARDRGLDVHILGRGSNLVISDYGLPGLVVDMCRGMNGVTCEGTLVRCEAGAALHAVVRRCAAHGLAGLEFLAGIPGTLGGAVVMNAGAFGREIAEVVTEVLIFDPTLDTCVRLGPEQLAFGYRRSALTGSGRVVLEVTLRLREASSENLMNVVKSVMHQRQEKQPLDQPNCGSVFRNPLSGEPAGRQIEAAGLKGRRRGGIQVSPKHANFFVNLGGGTAEDFRGLTHDVQKEVYVRSGTILVPEVVFWGKFDEPLFEPQKEGG